MFRGIAPGEQLLDLHGHAAPSTVVDGDERRQVLRLARPLVRLGSCRAHQVPLEIIAIGEALEEPEAARELALPACRAACPSAIAKARSFAPGSITAMSVSDEHDPEEARGHRFLARIATRASAIAGSSSRWIRSATWPRRDRCAPASPS
jgi:hypothetical protein